MIGLPEKTISESASTEAVRNYMMVYYGLASDIDRLITAKNNCYEKQIKDMLSRQIESLKFVRRALKKFMK